MTVIFGELLCYVLFFYHVYRSDKVVSKLLFDDERQRRRRKNVISFLGQFYVFCAKFITLLVFIFATIQGKTHVTMKALAMVTKFTEFGMLSIVEVMTSPAMRNELFDRWRPIFGLFSYLIFWL